MQNIIKCSLLSVLRGFQIRSTVDVCRAVHLRRNLLIVDQMAQKSITSFFSKSIAPKASIVNDDKPAKLTPKKEVIDEIEDSCSPLKNTSKTSKRLRIDSESDSNSPPTKRNSTETALAEKEAITEAKTKEEIIKNKSPTNKRKQTTPKPKKTPAEKKSAKKTPVPKQSPVVSKKPVVVAKEEENVSEKEDPSQKKSNKKQTIEKRKHVSSSESSENDEVVNDKKSKKSPPASTKVAKKTSPAVGKEAKEVTKNVDSDSDAEAANKKQTNGKYKNEKKNPVSGSESSESDEDIKEKPKNTKALKQTNGVKKEVKTPSPPTKKLTPFHSFFTSTKSDLKSENATEKKTQKSDSSGVNYNPAQSNYHPVDDAAWSRGEKVPYLALARTMEEIEKISARLKIVEILSNFFRSVIVLTPEDLLPSVYLCLNRLAPAYESVELGIAETTLLKAIAQSTGRSVAQVKSESKASGDLGIVAEQSKSTQRMMFQPAALSIRLVFDKLKEIAMMTGHSSMAKKVDKIQSMFVACRHAEARYLIRSLQGKLRIGLAEQSVLQAVAQACATTPPLPTQDNAWPPNVVNASKGLTAEQFKAVVDEHALTLKTTYCSCPNYDMLIPVLLQHGVAALPEHCRLTPGIPLKPMLAHPTKGVHEVLHRFENVEFTCEWKYDGERAQIHVPSLEVDGKVTADLSKASIYSRNQENNTSKYPDVLGRLTNTLKDTVHSCVLDCEAVAWDKEKKQILPFQVLSTRKRKDANEADIKVAVCLFMFDLLYFNGEPLVTKPFEERRRLLRENFNTLEGEWHMATSLDCSTTESIQDFLEESVKGNCEGLMVKTLNGKDATYEIAKRSRNWLKLKKDYLDGVGDTIDAVVMGGYLGRGKRAGVYGGFLLACHDRNSDEYQTLCKIGTGFSDEDLKTHSQVLKEHILDAPKGYYRYDSSLEPDHWFAPAQVWEIKCADLSLSPIHRAALGIVDPDKGISLRFPRFIRVREDKTPEEATSAQQIADLYCNQDQVKNQTGGGSKNVEDDFY